MVENAGFAVGISTLAVTVTEISGFGDHFRLSVVIEIVLGHYELVVVENRRLVVGILMISVVLSETSISGLGGHIAIFGSPSSSKLLPLKSPSSTLPRSQLKWNQIDVF